MNDKIHEELTSLERELSRLDTAVRDIETAKDISKNVINAADNLSKDFSMFYEKLNSSFEDIKNQHKHILNEYSSKFDVELDKTVEQSKNELNTANQLFNENLDKIKVEIDSISAEYSNNLNLFDEKIKSITNELNELLSNNNELREKIEAIFKEIDDLHLPLKFDKLDTTISAISQGIQNIQGRIDSLESNVIRETDNQRKKISDEMEMVTIGMNNINHSVEDNFNKSTDQINNLKKGSRVIVFILVLILILSIVKFFI